jgi:hypothetical protein
MKWRKNQIVCAVSWFVVCGGCGVLLTDLNEDAAMRAFVRATEGWIGSAPVFMSLVHVSSLLGNLAFRFAAPFAIILAVRSSLEILHRRRAESESAVAASMAQSAPSDAQGSSSNSNGNTRETNEQSTRLRSFPSHRKLLELWLTVWLLLGWGGLHFAGPEERFGPSARIARELFQVLFGRTVRFQWLQIVAALTDGIVMLPTELSLAVCIPASIVLTIAFGIVSMHESFKLPAEEP